MVSSVSEPLRRAAVVATAALAVLATGCTHDGSAPSAAPTVPSSPAVGSTAADPGASPSALSAPVVEVRLRVERRTPAPATAGFVEQAMAVLTDPRGWQRAGFRFVADDDGPFLLVLADGAEVDRLCEPYDTAGAYSCQNGPVVALNADRWGRATPDWPGDLAGYRAYLVNHEIGHLLHLHHPSPQCPGDGLPAPVMLQQSTELGACTANPWPLPWEVDLAAERREPLAPAAEHPVDDHRPSPPPQQQDLDHRPGGA